MLELIRAFANTIFYIIDLIFFYYSTSQLILKLSFRYAFFRCRKLIHNEKLTLTSFLYIYL